MTRCVLLHCRALVGALAALLIFDAAATWSQEPAERPARFAPARAEPTKITVFHLQHASAEETAGVLRSLMVDAFRPGQENVAADPRTNAIIVRGADDVLEQVEAILKVLDQPQEAAETKVFSLKNIAADAKLQSVLLELVGDGETKVAVEPVSNTVLVHGSPQTLGEIEALLLRLDEAPAREAAPPEAPQAGQDMQVRVVWLVAGGKLADAGPPPPDLENVVRELEKMGVSGLKTATQIFVKTLEQNPFNVNGTASLGQPVHVEISGAFRRKRGDAEAAGPLLLEIQIRATDPTRNKPLADLQTAITAPEGHSVVLGVAPMGEMTSVFVVQLRK